jgi:hypothetical protein
VLARFQALYPVACESDLVVYARAHSIYPYYSVRLVPRSQSIAYSTLLEKALPLQRKVSRCIRVVVDDM